MDNLCENCSKGKEGEARGNDAEHRENRNLRTVVTLKNSKDHLDVRNFDELPLCEELLQGIRVSGYESPPPMLTKALIAAMEGHDVIINSWLETNERLICPLLALQKIDTSVQQCQVLILSSGAQQAEKTQQGIIDLGRFMNVFCHACHNGRKLKQDRKMGAGTHIIVGTPDRLYDMMRRNFLITSGVRLFVLQDATQLLKKVRSKIHNIFETFAPKVQVLLLSTFLEAPMIEECRRFLRDEYFIVTSKQEPIPEGIRQFYIPISIISQKREVLYDFCKKFDASHAIIFCSKTKKTKFVENGMTKLGFTVSALHGGKNREERQKIINNFYASSNGTLITTDTFLNELPKNVPTIVNFDSPDKRKYYGRMYKSDPSCGGVIINFCTTQENIIIEKFYKTKRLLTAPLYGISSLPSFNSNDECCEVPCEEYENTEKSDSSLSGQIPTRNIKNFYVLLGMKKLRRNILYNLYTDLNIKRAVIFCDSKRTVKELTKEMREKSYHTLDLYKKDPAKKKRLTLEDFNSAHDRTLITNDSLKNSRIQVPIIIYYHYYRHEEANYTSRIPTGEWFSPQGIIISFVAESERQYLHETEYFRDSKIQHLIECDSEYNRNTTSSEDSCANLLQNLDIVPDTVIELCSDNIPQSFEDMDLSCELLKNVRGYGLKNPTVLQQRALNACLRGHSVIMHAKPNMGTEALSIAALQRVDPDVKGCQELILAPTKDQIMEIQRVISTLKGSIEAYCERCVVNSDNSDCVNQCKMVAQIAMGTPEFLEYRMYDQNFAADKIKMFILYEAEKLLSEKYRKEILRLHGLLNPDVQIILLTSNITDDVWKSPIFMRDLIYVTS